MTNQSQPIIRLMKTDQELMLSFPVLKQLRTHIREEKFIGTIRRLEEQAGYQLVAVLVTDQVKAVAGYRITENLAWGKFLYVDDLVTDEQSRAEGHAGLLMNWLEDEARRKNCNQFHLDSAVHRFGAHRFYLKSRMDITCHHFQKEL
ncbi:Acetyltransferase (GNAT) family protein [Seinonella peptonophila]|uniref:Acetyltransferase (GNAT) family protein n=1 Tax=Seinonella peptonophila TaxID=112248 RepID=A0A1M4X493_9BACL|nr:GNAT family N-acetyltransferase [Seinonella peptonophila]SHE88270.1 Acetyltransferase (GNAT) family protein [Seinonella peptonophila]